MADEPEVEEPVGPVAASDEPVAASDEEPVRETTFNSRLTPRERQIGWLAAAVIGIGGPIEWIASGISNSDAGAFIVAPILLVAGGLLALAVRYGRRLVMLIAVVVMSFIPPSPYKNVMATVQLGMLAFAGYLMIKTSNAAGKRAGLERRERAEARRAARKAGRTEPTPTRAGPAPKASKRYTPPKKSSSKRR